MSDFPDSDFWDFSLAVYGTEGVAPACLELQERYELDVNLLLFAAWVGASGRGRLGADDRAALTGLVAAWHRDVVRHLRHLRVALRPGFDGIPDTQVQSLRRRIQKAEIDAEHIEQLVLSDWAAARDVAIADPEKRLSDADENMADYTGDLGPVEATAREKLTIIGDACRAWLAAQS